MTDIINITPLAWQKIHNKVTAANKDYIGVKVGITTRGCSGYSYVIELTSEQPADLENFVKDGDYMVIVTPQAEMFVCGATLDYVVKDKFTEGFDFINNNETSRCGCGESFNV